MGLVWLLFCIGWVLTAVGVVPQVWSEIGPPYALSVAFAYAVAAISALRHAIEPEGD